MSPVPYAGDDVLPMAVELVEGATAEAVPLRLIGGLAVRVLCPAFPPRVRARQDLDVASVSSARPRLTEFLVGRGYAPDKRFNALYGHKQLFFSAPDGRAVDVLVDRLDMCHVLEFKSRIERMQLTLDVTDVLLSKLQIVELNEKDAQDALYLLSAYEVQPGDEVGAIGLERIAGIVGDDWGWWRTLTLTLGRIRELATAEGSRLVPSGAAFEPVAQIDRISRAVDETPKSLRWKIRARVGERKRWYTLPEEESHD